MPSERLRSGAESEPSRRQTDRKVALTCEGVEHTHHAGGASRWHRARLAGAGSPSPQVRPGKADFAAALLGTPFQKLSPSRTTRQVMTTRCLNVRSDKSVSAPVPTLSAIMIAHAG